jgi:N-acetylglucosaminyldiphosphoundecaprenol N-acetyl-beta-D-mannosaminyltransferase
VIDRGRHSVLGVRIDAMDYEAVVGRILAAARARRPLAASAMAVHGVMTGALCPRQRYRLNRLDLLLPDGQPVRWALNLLHGTRLEERVYGPRLTLELCRAAADEGLSIFLYGSTPRVLAALRARLLRLYPRLRLAGSRPSAFRTLRPAERSELVGAIEQSGAALVLVGLGCPRQEIWVFEHRGRLSIPLVAVGAAFELCAGVRPQAPPILQRHGLEWLFRLGQEPRRLWRRYFLLNPLFVVLTALQAAGVRLDPDGGVAPTNEIGWG